MVRDIGERSSETSRVVRVAQEKVRIRHGQMENKIRCFRKGIEE